MIKKITLLLSLLLLGFTYAQLCSSFQIKDALGGVSANINCSYPLHGPGSKCLTLTATPPIIKETTDYIVQPISGNSPVAYNAGTALNFVGKDQFSTAINIPFTFCFYGMPQSKVVIGSNGVITFNTNLAGTINASNFSDTIPSGNIVTNSISGIMQDLIYPDKDPNTGSDDVSEIYYSVVGTAPCRKFIVSFYQARMTGCEDRVNSQIVLNEGSNEIEVYTDGKPKACISSAYPNALIGIQNDAGTIGLEAPGRNTGEWQAGKEAWRFIPNGSVIIPTIKWYDVDKNLLGTGSTMDVCPDDVSDYTSELSYNSCGTDPYVLTDIFSISFDNAYPAAVDFTQIFCEATNPIVNIDDLEYKKALVKNNTAFFNYSYYNSLAAAEAALPGTEVPTQNISIIGNEVYWVRVSHPTNPSCYRIAKLSFKFITSAIKTMVLDVCDEMDTGVMTNYALSKFNAKLFNNPTTITIRYYDHVVPNSPTPPAGNITTANLTTATQLWVWVNVKGCIKVFGPISITMNAGPTVNTRLIEYPQIEICDTKGDKIEEFDFLGIFGPMITSDTTKIIKFYANPAGTGAEVKSVREGLKTYYARVQEASGGCVSVVTIKMDIKFKLFKADAKVANFCYTGAVSQNIDFVEASKEMLKEHDDIANVKLYFYELQIDADQVIRDDVLFPPLPEPTIEVFEDPTKDVVTKYLYVRFEDPTGCFIVRRLTINLVNVRIKKDHFDVCDLKNDGKEVVSLNNFSTQIRGPQPGVVTYFLNPTDAATDANPKTLVTLSAVSTTYYAKLLTKECSRVFPITINLIPTPSVPESLVKNRNNICDNNNDGTEKLDLTQYLPEIYNNASQVVFEFYKNYNPANNTFSNPITLAQASSYPVTTSTTVFVKTKFKTGTCFSVTELTIKTNFYPGIILHDVVLMNCNYGSDNNVPFDLNDAIPKTFIQSENQVPFSDFKTPTFYESESDALLAVNSVSNNQTPLVSPFFWVRFESKVTGCFSTAKIELKLRKPPIPKVATVLICDNNLDGTLDVNLLLHRAEMIDFVSSTDNVDNYTFEFYEDAALTLTRLIATPENYTVLTAAQQKVWVKILNAPDCFVSAEVLFKYSTAVVISTNGPYNITDCDAENDGIEIVNLKQFETQIYNTPTATFNYYPSLQDLHDLSNEITNPAAYTYDENLGINEIFVKVSDSRLCPTLTKIEINLRKVPKFSLPDRYFCPGIGIDIEPDFSALGIKIKSYEWIDPKGGVSGFPYLRDIKEAGKYTLTLTSDNLCSYTSTFNVVMYDVPIITQLIPNGSTFTVIATGNGEILYSIDGVNWQTSNVFNNLPNGVNNFYVKFKDSGCLGEMKQGIVVTLNNAFSPNGDGINDVWGLGNLYVFDGKQSSLKIFNRNGIVVYQKESAEQLFWDGKISGSADSTGSYWYMMNLPDGRVFTGWILLKNR